MTILGHLEKHPGTNPASFTSKLAHFEPTIVQFDRTEFYPSGGGQPADKGILSGEKFRCRVIDVQKSGSVVSHHISEIEGEPSIGEMLSCEIDVEWRNQLSAMHTAQHIISALSHEEWGAETVGNQIGFDKTRIDLKFENRELFSSEHLEEIVNWTLRKNLDVKMDFRPSKDLLDDPLVRVNMARMPPNIDIWRTISIGDIDVCPCAGTHVQTTREIPDIEITRVKSKGAGRLRVEYILNECYKSFN
ncbi:MAG: alanyl-tRNA editing protein [Candidatus Thermoplasmatota archaeon]|nr:alanyl-tRNA editing protein [Candidatus Thermoplasmatota archaeon]